MDQTRFDDLVASLHRTPSRRQALKIAAGAAAGGLAALAGLSVAGAQVPQNQFVKDCKAAGGTSSSVGIRVVRCCQKGFCTTCNYNYDPPYCRESFNRHGTGDVVGGVGGGEASDQP